jgi:hypothetical protein
MVELIVVCISQHLFPVGKKKVVVRSFVKFAISLSPGKQLQ